MWHSKNCLAGGPCNCAVEIDYARRSMEKDFEAELKSLCKEHDELLECAEEICSTFSLDINPEEMLNILYKYRIRSE